MKHFRIDNCTCNSPYCFLNDFLFYHDFDFYIITSSSCLGYGDLFNKEMLLNSLLKSKNSLLYKVSNSSKRMPLDESFKEFRLRNLNLKRMINEVNLIYSCVGNVDRCLTTQIAYIDMANNQDLLKKNYDVAKKYLNENGYNFMLLGENSLHELYKHNSIMPGSDLNVQTVKTIDKLIKKIKNEINN